MGNRSTPARSFNTLKHSNREQRRKRRRRERMVLLSIFTVACAIFLSLAIFLIASLVDVIKTNNPPGEQENETSNNDTFPPASIAYQSVTQANTAVHTGDLVIVNTFHEYVFPTTATDLKNIYDNRVKYQDVSNTYFVGDTKWKLQATALDAFNAMMLKHYELFEDGSIKISSAYRSYEDQASSVTSSTPAGFSDHHTGLCIALRPDDGTYLESDHWIYQNCHKYGFVIRYPDAKSAITGVNGYDYCLRYVGIPHATYMTENNLCMEEYVELLKTTYGVSTPLAITAADGLRYEIYYIPAGSGDVSTLQIPKNRQYTLSGDNIGGFIVTVSLDQTADA